MTLVCVCVCISVYISTGLPCLIPVCVCTCVFRFAGYDTGACRQPAQVAYTLKLLIGAAPVAFIVTGLLILLLYPISEDVRLRNKLCLEELRWVTHTSLLSQVDRTSQCSCKCIRQYKAGDTCLSEMLPNKVFGSHDGLKWVKYQHSFNLKVTITCLLQETRQHQLQNAGGCE